MQIMDYDDINSISLALFDFLVDNLGLQLSDNDYDKLSDKLFYLLDRYSLGDYRNYN